MFLPDFIFEDEDIPYLKNQGIFLCSYIDKRTDTNYFKLNTHKLNELIDLIYNNYNITERDRSDVEFDIKIIANIFTSIIEKENHLNIINCILNYHKVSPLNAKRLMSYLRYEPSQVNKSTFGDKKI